MYSRPKLKSGYLLNNNFLYIRYSNYKLLFLIELTEPVGESVNHVSISHINRILCEEYIYYNRKFNRFIGLQEL